MRAVLVVLSLFLASTAFADVKIEALGQGGAVGNDLEQTRRRALDDGLRQAVDQVIGSLVDPAIRQKNAEIIKTRVLRRARAYVISHRILDEGAEAGVYQVHVEAVVADQALKKDLAALSIPLLGGAPTPVEPRPPVATRPGVGVLVIGAAPAGLAESTVAGLSARGLVARALPAAEAIDDAAAVSAARAGGVASVLVVSAKSASDGRIRGTRLLGVRVELEARLIGADSGVPVARWSGSAVAGGAGVDEAGALAGASRAAGLRLAALVMPALAEELATPAARPAEGIVVRMRGVVRWQEAGTLARALAQVPGVDRLVADGASRGELRFRAVGRASVDALAAAVPGTLGAVAERKADLLEIELYPPAPVTPVPVTP